MLIGFVLKLFNGLRRLIGDFRASCRKLLLPLFERQPPLRGHRLRSRLPRGRLNLLLGIRPQPPVEARLRPRATPHPFPAPAAATPAFPAPHPASSSPASTAGMRSNHPVEKRCPRRCRKLPAPAPPEKAAAPFEAVESKPLVPAPCAAAAPLPGAVSPSSPTYFSGRNVSTGSGSHGN